MHSDLLVKVADIKPPYLFEVPCRCSLLRPYFLHQLVCSVEIFSTLTWLEKIDVLRANFVIPDVRRSGVNGCL